MFKTLVFVVLCYQHIAQAGWFDGFFDNRPQLPVVGVLNKGAGVPLGHATSSKVGNYLAVILANDSGRRGGGFAFIPYDQLRNKPRAFFTKVDHDTEKIREGHGYGFSVGDGRTLVALQTIYGIQIWDWTDVASKNIRMLADLALPGIEEEDYSKGAWWVFYQAPYIYVGGSSNGLYVINATNPAKPFLVKTPTPITQTGNFRVGPVYAVGSKLIISGNDAPGYAVLDISDPENPQVLTSHVSDIPKIYSSLFNGGFILGAGSNDYFYLHAVTDDNDIRAVGQVNMEAGKGGYVSFQDGFAHVGASKKYVKVDMRDPANLKTVAFGTGGIAGTDEDFANVHGDLVVIGDDHAKGSAIIKHMEGFDTNPPQPNFVSPANHSIEQKITTGIGLTFTDQIDLESINPQSFIVRPKGGSPVSGYYSSQTGIVNFRPAQPLLPGTTYEIFLPQGGIADHSGNHLNQDYKFEFKTAGQAPVTLDCTIQPSIGTLLGQKTVLAVAAPAGGVSYSWQFGDGQKTSFSTSNNSVQYQYANPGHYTVVLTAKLNSEQKSCSRRHTVFTAPTPTPARSSKPLLLREDANQIWNVNPDNDSVSVSSLSDLKLIAEVSVGKHPQSLALSSSKDIWVTNKDDSTISIVGGTSLKLLGTISLPVGSQPHGILMAPDGNTAYVTLEGRGQLALIDVPTKTVKKLAQAVPTSRALAMTADGSRIFVSRFISTDEYGEVAEMTAAGDKVTIHPLLFDTHQDREDNGRGVPNYIASLTISPDGSTLLASSKKDNIARGLVRDGLKLTFENSVRTIVSHIDLKSGDDLSKRIDLNDRDLAYDTSFTPAGDFFFVAVQGSNLIDVYDAYNKTLITTIKDAGLAPQGVILNSKATQAFVQSFLSRTIEVYDVRGITRSGTNNYERLASIKVVKADKLSPQVLLGKQIFYNARDLRMSKDGYISCASCHLDGGLDGRTWDFTDRGEGLRNTTTLKGKGGTAHGRLHWTANFDEIQDFEHDIRNAFGGKGFLPDDVFNQGTRNTSLGDKKAGLSPELDAMAAYVSSLTATPVSPYRQTENQMTEQALRGEKVFNRVNCQSCHSGSIFTDSPSGKLHDVGTLTPNSGNRLGGPLTGLDTPTLLGLWNTAPYLHDGSARTIKDVFEQASKGGGHDGVKNLSESDRQDLLRYLLEL